MSTPPESAAFLPSSGVQAPPPGVAAWLLARLRDRVGPVPLRFQLWDGTGVDLGDGRPVATIRVRDRGTLLRLAWDPDRHFGDAYADGAVTVEGDLVAALEVVYRAVRPRWTERERGARRRRRGGATPPQAERNARHHYDLGNDFYRLWLDEQMVYTCAYFPEPEASLEEAQVAKMDMVCRKLRLRPGERVFEAGCGWGGLACHMAARYGVHVTACNVSREQIRFAREQAAARGVAGRVTFVGEDFRRVDGRFDAFVSVGMLEHVGAENYRDLGRVIHERLDPDRGRGLLHFIGRNSPAPLNAWIRKRIFPGGYPPALAEVFAGILEPWEFSVLDVENLRLHYAKTLEHWRARFERRAEEVAQRYGPSFARAWRLYLAGSQVAFATGYMQLFQVTFARGEDNDVPWTRAPLYQSGGAPAAAAEDDRRGAL